MVNDAKPLYLKDTEGSRDSHTTYHEHFSLRAKRANLDMHSSPYLFNQVSMLTALDEEPVFSLEGSAAGLILAEALDVREMRDRLWVSSSRLLGKLQDPAWSR